MAEFKETHRLWFDYPEIHLDATRLFTAMQAVKEGPAFLIAVGRGGWLPSRLVAANYESTGVPCASVSLLANYNNLGTPEESVGINQGLDDIALQSLKEHVFIRNFTPWVIDGPYMAGRTVTEAQSQVARQAAGITPFIGVLHWVTFEESQDAPWRRGALQPPDAYGRHFHLIEKPYVEYPWEYADYEAYKLTMQQHDV